MSAQPAPTTKRTFRLPAEIALGCLLALFFILRAFALIPHPADEGIYFYGALRWSQGLWPYRDFFHAHPPLHLLPTALLFKVFGYSLLLAKLPTFVAAAFLGIAAYVVTIKVAPAKSQTAKQVAGLMAATALLFAESLLKASATDTGICQAGAWVGLAAMLLALHFPTVAGAVAAVAPLTLLQAGPAAAVVVAASILLGKRAALRCTISSIATFAAVHLLFWWIAGNAFWQQVYGFHLEKVGTVGEGSLQLGFVIFDNWTLFTLATSGTTALFLGTRQTRILATLAIAAAALTIVAMATRPRVFPFYFQPAFLPLALLIGWGFATALDHIASWWKTRGDELVPTRIIWVPAVVLLLLVGPLAGSLSSAISPKRASQLSTYSQIYSWVDAPGIGAINSLIKILFWQDGIRVVNEDANAITQYLWQRSRWLDIQPAMVAAVAEQASPNPQLSLFGDSTIAPLVALQAHVPLTADLVDTNMQRVRTGNLAVSEILALLETSPQALLLLGASGGIGALPELRAYVGQHYSALQEFQSPYGYRYTLWRRR